MYDAFGDESCDSQTVCYGMLLVPSEKKERVEKILASVKMGSGGQPSYPLHCREMFMTDARNKTPWAHLNFRGVIDLYTKLFTSIKEAGLRSVVAVARMADFPEKLPQLEMKHIDSSLNMPPILTKELPLGQKQFAVWCGQGAMLYLSKDLGTSNIRFWLDPEDTRIDWIMSYQQTSSATASFFMDINPGQEPIKPTIMTVGSPKPVLLQIADAIAYMARRSMVKPLGASAMEFKKLYKILSSEEVPFGIAPDGGFGFNLPNRSH